MDWPLLIAAKSQWFSTESQDPTHSKVLPFSHSSDRLQRTWSWILGLSACLSFIIVLLFPQLAEKQTTQTMVVGGALGSTAHSFRLYQIIESPNRLIKFTKCHDCIFSVFPSAHLRVPQRHTIAFMIGELGRNAKYFAASGGLYLSKCTLSFKGWPWVPCVVSILLGIVAATCELKSFLNDMANKQSNCHLIVVFIILVNSSTK